MSEHTANAIKLIKSISDLNEARGEEQFFVALDIALDGKYSKEDVESGESEAERGWRGGGGGDDFVDGTAPHPFS